MFFWAVLLFQIYIDSKKLFFQILALSFLKFGVIVYRQSDYWDREFGPSNHEVYSCNVIIMFYYYTVVFHDKSSSTLQFIKGKSRNLQKFLRYLSVTSTFKDGTSGCAGRSTSPGFPYCGGLSGVSGFVLYSNGVSFKALPLTSTSSTS